MSPKNDPIGQLLASHTLGKSPLCDGPREVWSVVVVIRPLARGSYTGENSTMVLNNFYATT